MNCDSWRTGGGGGEEGDEEEVKEETVRSYCIIAASLKMSKVCFEFPITSAKEGH